MKPKRFTALVFVFVIAGFMLTSLFAMASRKLIDTPATPRHKFINRNWESIYPFEEGSKEMNEKISSFYNYVKGRIKEYTSSNLPGYYKMTEAAKKYEYAINWNMVSVFDYNAVIRLKDGYLTSYTMSRDVTHDSESLKEFADFCAGKGIYFMYINIPAKICKSEDKNISGVLDFVNQNADKLLAMLKESGVRNYDLRENLHAAGMKHHESFYTVDHHWKTETGLWAAGEILKILHDDFCWPVEPDILKPENFEFVIYRDWFIGSQGKKLTLARAKPVDFAMIYPKFETHMKFEAVDFNLNKEGDFSILYDMNEISEKDFYGKEPYWAYLYRECSLKRLENRIITNGKRLLMIVNSFASCVIPFVALDVQYVDVIDLRRFNGSVRSFVAVEKPDAVIVFYPSGVKEHFMYDLR